jgi:hypothetical protein
MRVGSLAPMSFAGTLCAAALSWCESYRNFYHWTKPGLTQQQSDADWYQCVKENTAAGLEVQNLGGDIETRPTQNTNEGMALQCMKARGYTITGVEKRRVE